MGSSATISMFCKEEGLDRRQTSNESLVMGFGSGDVTFDEKVDIPGLGTAWYMRVKVTVPVSDAESDE